MSRDADRLLAYGEMPARCVAKVGCRVADSDSEYVPEYVANRSMIDVLRSTTQISRFFNLRGKGSRVESLLDFCYPTKMQ